MIVYEHNNVEMEYHSDINILEVRWIGILQAKALKLLIGKLVEIASIYAISNILLDATQVDAMHELVQFDGRGQSCHAQPFGLTKLKRIARVSSEQVPGEESISRFYHNLVTENRVSFDFKNFHHHYEAIEWLMEE